MPFFRGLTRKKQSSSSASEERRKKEEDCYLKNGAAVLEELLSLCDGNCRIPIRYFTAIEIERAIKYSKSKMELSDVYMVTGSMDNRAVLVRFNRCLFNIHRDIAITAQMSHLNNVLRLVGCCLEFEEPVMVYEYVEGISLSHLLLKKGSHDDQTRKSLSWGNRLRVTREVASAIVFLHTEFTTPIIHRDIKPSKVIIDKNTGVAKIVDFSLSISLPPGELEVEDALCGTFGYVDPEYAISGIITQKTDIYSFGVLLFQLLTGKEMCDIMKSNITEGHVMDRVDSAILEETIDVKEDAEFNIEEDNVMNKVDSVFEEKIEFKEDVKSNIEDDNAMVRVHSAVLEETIYFDIEEGNATNPVDSTISINTNGFTNILTNFLDHHIKEGGVMDIADPTIIEEHGIEIQQQLVDYLDLVKKCTLPNTDDRPYMIHVARELRRIEKCFHALKMFILIL